MKVGEVGQISPDVARCRAFRANTSLRRFIGVADLASVRFSLPSQLLEPTPNLEYWNYLDSPNAFVAIGTADDPVDRMLEVLRFWFTKDLKYAKGKPCKPYNSCLGEFFRVGRSQHQADSKNLRNTDGMNWSVQLGDRG